MLRNLVRMSWCVFEKRRTKLFLLALQGTASAAAWAIRKTRACEAS